MRFVSRKRLAVVMVIAAASGVVLPYVELLCRRIVPGNASTSALASGNRIYGTVASSVCEDSIQIWRLKEPTKEDKVRFAESCPAFIPAEYVKACDDHMFIEMTGWPFRATYQYFTYTDRGLAQGSAIIRTPDWLEPFTDQYLPPGILWGGVAGNVGVMVVVFASIYLGQAYWRGRRR